MDQIKWPLGEQKANMLRFRPCRYGSAPSRSLTCAASGTPWRCRPESLFEAAIFGVRTFSGDPWIEHVGPATVLDIEVREPAAKHPITMMQVERWLEGASTSPNEGVKKAKLKDLLIAR